MTFMAGRLVSLRPGRGDDDILLVARWLAAATAVHSSRGPRFLTLPAARAVVAGDAREMLIAEVGDEPVGALLWQSTGPAGGYSVEHIVGVPATWDDGAGGEAVSLLLGYLFQGLNAHRVQMVTGVFDRMMVQIVVDLGLSIEGVLRDYFYLDGRYHHAVVSAILAADFRRTAGPDRPGSPAVSDEDKESARRILSGYLAAANADPAARMAGSGQTLDPD
jgi:hypothetical protein